VVEADPRQIEFLAARCRAAQRGVITLGATSPSAPSLGAALAKVLDATPLVLLCEATSQVRLSLPPEISRESVFDSFDLHFAGREASDLTPDFVLQLGAPPTSGSWERFLASAPDCELHVVTEHGWPDPTSRAASVTQASLPMLLERLASRLDSNPMEAPSSWRDRVQARNAQAWAAVESTLAAARTKSSLDEALAVRIALEALPKGSLLALGNSLAVREVDTVLPAGDRGLRVWSQRGANGIDGLISGASGAASQYSGPCLLLLGDISFLHDVGGLKAAQALRSALVIAVLNNGGGRIFEQLPLMQTPGLAQERLELWLTPQDHELTRAAELYGLRGTTVRTAIDLEQALAAALTHEGATVIDIRVGASSAAEGRKAILSELARATARGKSSA
jgi:2-succinyl-5-enolpyruvyl-6-hydroxy-3-cyclohexene-1-carboxylate synthase